MKGVRPMVMVRLAIASQMYALAILFLSLACETSAGVFIRNGLADARRESLIAVALICVASGMSMFVPPFDDRFLWKKSIHGIAIIGLALFLLALVAFNAR